MKMIELTHKDIAELVEIMSLVARKHLNITVGMDNPARIYGIPRGGIPVAYLLGGYFRSGSIVDDIKKANIIVDDLVDSGATRDRYQAMNPNAKFISLINKEDFNDWVTFPWEKSDTENTSADDIPIRLLQFIGEDITRGGLKETPKRFLKAWAHWSNGYKQNPEDIMKTFEDGAEKYDEMVLVKDIPVYSHCEHHLAPFFGIAHVAYIPDKKVLGLSKISRLVDIFAQRLQVQERLTSQIADSMMEHLKPKGVAVIIDCRHMCMESRGIQRQGSSTITSSMKGVFLEKPEVRAEFMGLIK